MILPPIVIANLGLRSRWARIVTLVLVVLAIFLVVVNGAFVDLISAVRLRDTGESTRAGLAAGGVFSLLAGAISSALLVTPSRYLPRWLPIDPESVLDMAALAGVVLLIGNEIAFQLTTDAVAKVSTSAPLDRLDVIFGELPLLLAALLGVGLFTRRSFPEALDRLGLVRPRWWQIVLGLAAAGVFYLVSQLGDELQRVVTPDLAHRLGAATQHLYGGLSDPVGIAVIALSAGIAEEALFRGALQPRLGLILVAVAFVAVHVQYGVSFDTLVVFVLGAGLGLIRKYTNTTTSAITHVGYNALAGISVAGVLLAPAVAIEAVLLLVLAVAAFPAGRRLLQR